jgi:hypothetical protein
MINHHQVQTELMKAVEGTRESRVQARKQVEAIMSAASTSRAPEGRSTVQDAFRAHALATAAHNLARRELREFYLDGKIPHRLEYIATDALQRVWGALAPTELHP